MTIPEGRKPITDKDLADLTRRLAETAIERNCRCKELEAERDDYAWRLNEASNTYTEMHIEIERLSDENKRLREGINRLKNPPKRYCAKCGHPEDNHPYRHPFVALETKGIGNE